MKISERFRNYSNIVFLQIVCETGYEILNPRKIKSDVENLIDRIVIAPKDSPLNFREGA